MTRLASLLCTLACLGLPLSFAAGDAGAADTPLRLVSVSGAGEVKAQPDMAYVTIGAEARKATVDEARTEVNATVQRILALTKELKIDPKYVDSTRLQVQPDYRWDEKTQKQVLQGYLVNRQIDVEVRDLEKLGTLLEKAVSEGPGAPGARPRRRGCPPECRYAGHRRRSEARPRAEPERVELDADADVCGARDGRGRTPDGRRGGPVVQGGRDEVHGERERAVRAAVGSG
jgi:hypothetical protein